VDIEIGSGDPIIYVGISGPGWGVLSWRGGLVLRLIVLDQLLLLLYGTDL
jgi:hypothetical protein